MADDIDKECYIDKTYNLISNQVIDSSNYIDDSINNMLINPDSNTTVLIVKNTIHKKTSIDNFFRTKKFTDETDETYISVKLNSTFKSKETNRFNIGVNARIPLSKSTKKYNLFINGLKKDVTSNPITNQLNEQDGTEIGINYFATLVHKIKSRYSLGVNGLNLFTIARYSIEKDFYSWNILSAQEFKYSLKNLFEEETDIYFDKHLSDSRLFRITLLRATQEKNSGMDYSLVLQHYWILNKTAALNLSQLFSGNTQYEYKTKKYRGVTNYTTALSFRKTALRKWFYYGIIPSVNFNKEHNYEANYALNFYLEFYFGHLKK
ncbi:hypothetical protein [Sulfurimonas sp.]|uniref:hypothetical protein n=1 Tax=Sulfurimonas sp. TaxID=2022749 RepID=UPI002634322B|nr:hypothetical protein [Sulfurimonas sp.]